MLSEQAWCFSCCILNCTDNKAIHAEIPVLQEHTLAYELAAGRAMSISDNKLNSMTLGVVCTIYRGFPSCTENSVFSKAWIDFLCKQLVKGTSSNYLLSLLNSSVLYVLMLGNILFFSFHRCRNFQPAKFLPLPSFVSMFWFFMWMLYRNTI